MMSKTVDKFHKRRLRASYFTVILSITLVLTLVGFLGFVVLEYQNLSNFFKEKVKVTIYLNDEVSEDGIFAMQNTLKNKPFTNELVYISKQRAAFEFSKEVGEDFLEFLGDNPLKSYFELSVKGDYFTSSRMVFIKKELQRMPYVEEVMYDVPLVNLLTHNIAKIGFWLTVVAAVLSAIAVLLLNSSIRLSIYAKRFVIKTMQMVGATKSFIRKPFLATSVKLGLLGALFANIILGIIFYNIQVSLPELGLINEWDKFGIVIGGVFGLGILITLISSYFATQRFLRLTTEQLYY